MRVDQKDTGIRTRCCAASSVLICQDAAALTMIERSTAALAAATSAANDKLFPDFELFEVPDLAASGTDPAPAAPLDAVAPVPASPSPLPDASGVFLHPTQRQFELQ